jgi:hypothetical protein
MAEKSIRANALVKSKNLRLLLKEEKISRINKRAVIEIDKHLAEEARSLARRLKEIMIIEGKKNLTEKEVKEVKKALAFHKREKNQDFLEV